MIGQRASDPASEPIQGTRVRQASYGLLHRAGRKAEGPVWLPGGRFEVQARKGRF